MRKLSQQRLDTFGPNFCSVNFLLYSKQNEVL